MKNKVYVYGVLVSLFLALVISREVLVFARHDHQEHDVQSQPAGIQEKSFEQFMADAMMTMDSGMKAAPMTGNSDHDFAAMMIPHHQGAIIMAKAELIYGKDPVLRRLAQEIIVNQEQEIQVMLTRLKQFKAR